MDFFKSLERTETGRPRLLQDELELFSQSAINLYDGEEKTTYRYGRCVITSHRLFWIHDEKNIAIMLSLEHIHEVFKEAGFLSRSAKLKIQLNRSKYIKLSFKHGGRDDFYTPLDNSLKRQAWKDIQPSTISDKRLENHRQFSTSNAGITGILRRQEKEQKQANEIASQAFEDLNALMENAKDMVALIERYAATSESKRLENQTSQQETKKDEDEMNSLLLTMGITNPVTRENSGAQYHQELARQLAEFLKTSFKKYGGIISLTDVYCLFNRARGTELISPEDLRQASKLLKPLHLGMHIREFEGGLIVIQSDMHNEEKVIETLLRLIDRSTQQSITSSDVAAHFKISVVLAREYLKMAEKYQKLCRDDTFEGLNFYRNQFPQFYQTTFGRN